MATPPPRLDDDDAMFRRLAELDMAWAEKAHAHAMAATEVDDINSLGRTYQRAARSLRQTLALKAKIKADRERQARDARAEQVEAGRAAAKTERQRELYRLIERSDWREAREAPDFEDDDEDEDVLPDDASEADIRAWMARRAMDPTDPSVIRLFELFEIPLPPPEPATPPPEPPDRRAADPAPASQPRPTSNGHDSS